MNWRKITAYALALFAAQAAIGFFEGFFAPASIGAALVSCLASFAVCGSIFAHLSTRQLSKPFAHAWVALALQIAAAAALSQVLAAWVGGIPVATIALEWLVLSSALLVGTALGSSLRRSVGHPTDA